MLFLGRPGSPLHCGSVWDTGRRQASAAQKGLREASLPHSSCEGADGVPGFTWCLSGADLAGTAHSEEGVEDGIVCILGR